jgi:hypothetical protein
MARKTVSNKPCLSFDIVEEYSGCLENSLL